MRGELLVVANDGDAARDLLSQVLSGSDAEVVGRWVELQVERGEQPPRLHEADLRAEAVAMLDGLRTGMASPLPLPEVVKAHEPLREALVDLSLRRARTGTPPADTAMAVLALKEALLEQAARLTADPGTLLAVAGEINRLLDAAAVLTFQAYVEGREEIIRSQHQQMLELSTPVVRLWRHVLAVPLIGTLDSTRTQVVMNGLLEAIQAHEARVAIIDITGVPMVDTLVAQHLLQTVSAVRLMGADCLISGIRPTIAQTITQLGIDLSAIVTRATLADALADAIRMTGDEPVRS
ncbi:STAS domain-containing protein [Crossiella sp. SN42]|uniref:STAS domain-containing protein n=1 Tax=Crossiella sp. SN42 TaxID=2944808 RepID=UPI00207C224E|nr:STAS domain-containing protein [Crossiella sp. SN42]MCO1574218.1 STAS domain-containing protein [Crossiella sp. SN42]